MIQQLRVLALVEDLSSQFPVPTWWLTIIDNSSSSGPNALFSLSWTPGIQYIHEGKILIDVKNTLKILVTFIKDRLMFSFQWHSCT